MPFKKGQSGNPGGRPKIPAHVREMARAHTKEAIKALAAALKDEKQRVAAALALLDRGWGKPAQPITGEDGVGPAEIVITERIVDAANDQLRPEHCEGIPTTH